MPRSPQAATHRRSQSLSQNPTRPLSEAIPIPQSASAATSMFPRSVEHPTARQVQASISPPPRESNNLPALPPIEDEENQDFAPPRRTGEFDKPAQAPPLSSSPSGSTFARRFSSILSISKPSGGDDASKKINKRQSLTLPRSFSRPTAEETEKQLASIAGETEDLAPPPSFPASQSAPMPGAAFHKRAATVLEPGPNGRRNHERRTSIGGSISRSATTASNSNRRASGQQRPSSVVGSANGPGGGGAGGVAAAEWGGLNIADEKEEDRSGGKEEQAAPAEFKPLYAKGLFRFVSFSFFSVFLSFSSNDC